MCSSLDFQSNIYITKMYGTMNIKNKIMCLNAVDRQLDVKNIQEFLKHSRY
jgi:hypothetical protein